MIKEIVIAVVGGGVVALGSYLLGVKENQNNIGHIKQELVEIKEIGKRNQDSLVATKLFIAQAHPDRDTSRLASIIKLQKFNKEEVEVLAQSLPEVKLKSGLTIEIVKLPKSLLGLVKKHKLEGNDFENFAAIANLPPREHIM